MVDMKQTLKLCVTVDKLSMRRYILEGDLEFLKGGSSVSAW